MRHLGMVLGAAVVACASSAQAGWVRMDQVAFTGDTTIVCGDQNEVYANTFHTYLWNITDATSATAYLGDRSNNILPDDHTYTDTINGDPLKTIFEELTNDTVYTWTGYALSIASHTDGVSVKFVSPATATGAFQDAVLLSDTEIVYSGVGSDTLLAPDDSVLLKYKILITPPTGYVGPVTYSITATPMIPEPASLGLLALGAMGLLVRRKA